MEKGDAPMSVYFDLPMKIANYIFLSIILSV